MVLWRHEKDRHFVLYRKMVDSHQEMWFSIPRCSQDSRASLKFLHVTLLSSGRCITWEIALKRRGVIKKRTTLAENEDTFQQNLNTNNMKAGDVGGTSRSWSRTASKLKETDALPTKLDHTGPAVASHGARRGLMKRHDTDLSKYSEATSKPMVVTKLWHNLLRPLKKSLFSQLEICLRFVTAIFASRMWQVLL